MASVDLLREYVERKPIVILQLYEADYSALLDSHRGVSDFTTALPHQAFEGLKAPTLCLLIGNFKREYQIYLGIIGSRAAVTTLHSRVRIRFTTKLQPASPNDLVNLLEKSAHRKNLQKELAKNTDITVLTPKLSSYLIERLITLEVNLAPINRLAEVLLRPTRFTNNRSLQINAIQMALKAFGLNLSDPAESLQLSAEGETGLTTIPIIEDNVIEHDARIVPNYQLRSSDLTGRAVFKRGNERLEVITANRRKLEEAFGVDLIYFNLTKNNVVMVQYKMLERRESGASGWVFTPDKQLEKELERMRKFVFPAKASEYEYRLNPSMFYLKFVKRDGAVHKSGIILPIDHYDLFIGSDKARGPRGGLRVNYEALDGRYLREQPFMNLIRDGYIGSYAETTDNIMTLVNAVLDQGRAVVTAIQSAVGNEDAGLENDQSDDDLVF